MSLATYNKIVNANRVREAEPSKAEPLATQRLSIQNHSTWLQAARTQEIFKEIANEIDKLEDEARTLALTFQQHQNPHGVIQRLIRAEELRNLIKTYGRVDTEEN